MEVEDVQNRFNLFFDRLVPCVAGRKLWSKQAMVTDYITRSGKVTVTDEAFAELCVMNYFEKWINGGQTRWTNDRGGSSNFQGWSEDAYAVFDKICVRISEQRQCCQEIESGFLSHAKDKYGHSGRANRKYRSRGKPDARELFNDLS